MTTTLATLQSEIADALNRTDLNSEITQAINAGIAYFAQRYKFWFNETTTTFATVASQFNYSSSDGVPTNIRSIDYLKIAINSTNNVPLIERTYDYIQTANVGNLTGTPSDYAYFKENFWIYPVANAVYTLTLSYTKSYTDLSSGSDTNDFTNNAQDLLINYAQWYVYDHIIKDYSAADRADVRVGKALAGLLNETTRVTTSHRKRPSTF